MRYSIFYVIPGKFAKYQQKLCKEYAKKFNEPYMLENPLPCHVTLKAPFDSNNIKEIENIVKKVCENRKSSNVNIKNIGNFHRKVVFFKITLSGVAKKIHYELIRRLKKINRLEWSEYEPCYKYHSTIIYGNTPESFNKIWADASKLNLNFTEKFNNITIMKKAKGRWKVHKTFKLK